MSHFLFGMLEIALGQPTFGNMDQWERMYSVLVLNNNIHPQKNVPITLSQCFAMSFIYMK